MGKNICKIKNKKMWECICEVYFWGFFFVGNCQQEDVRKGGDCPLEDLAKFDYKANMKHKF